MKIGIALYPGCDEYLIKTAEVLKGLGDVYSLPTFTELKKNPLKIFTRRFDVAIVNWEDNLIVSNKTGRLSLIGLIKFHLYVFWIKYVSRKSIFVRHNNFPHATIADEGEKINNLIDRFENYFDIRVTHSGHNTNDRRLYVPHPLYQNRLAESDAENIVEPYYLVFGRVERYKKIEELLEGYKSKKKLVVVGKTNDKEYINELESIAKGKNIEIRPGYITDADASRLVANADAMLITHNGKDMIVSGSYFYAISCNTGVIAMSTPFFSWLEKLVNVTGIKTFYDLSDLQNYLCEVESDIFDKHKIKEFAHSNFGPEVVYKYWHLVFQELYGN